MIANGILNHRVFDVMDTQVLCWINAFKCSWEGCNCIISCMDTVNDLGVWYSSICYRQLPRFNESNAFDPLNWLHVGAAMGSRRVTRQCTNFCGSKFPSLLLCTVACRSARNPFIAGVPLRRCYQYPHYLIGLHWFPGSGSVCLVFGWPPNVRQVINLKLLISLELFIWKSKFNKYFWIYLYLYIFLDIDVQWLRS